MKVKKLVALAVLLVLAGALMAACTGQGGTTSSGGGDSNTQVNSTGVSTTAPGNVSAFDALPEKPVRVATTEEDYQIISEASLIDLYLIKNMERRVPLGDKLRVAVNNTTSEYGYYDEDRHGNIIKTLYYPISGLSTIEGYGSLIGTYGNVPVVELNRSTDMVFARDNSAGSLTISKCKLVGCTIGWVDDENSIWNQNDLIPVSDPSSLRLVDLSGQPRSTPMDYEFGEELIAECAGQSYQVFADSYVYAIDDAKIEITGGDIDVTSGQYVDTLFGYDFAKLEPGLYYFQDLGIYKIV